MTYSSDGLVDVLRGAGVIFVGTILARALGLLGEILIARTLLPDRFGDVAFAYTIVSMLAVFVTFGTAKGVPRLMSGDETRGQKQRVFVSGLAITVPLGLVGYVALTVFSQSIGTLLDYSAVIPLLPAFGLYLITFPIQRLTVGGLRGIEQAWTTAVARNIGRIVGLGVFVAATLAGFEISGVIGYYVITQLAIALVAGYFLYQYLFAGGLTDAPFGWTELRETFSFSWPLAISSGFLILMGNLDIMMIGYFLNSTPVGYYRAIQPLTNLLLVILSSFVFLFMPVATKHYKRDQHNIVENLFTSTTKFISLATFPVVLVFALFAEDVVVAFYGVAYAPAAGAFVVLVMGMFLRVFVGPNAAMIKTINRTRVDMVSGAVGLMVNAALNLVLVPNYGIQGAALATSIGYLAYNAIELGVIYMEIGAHPFSKNTVKPMVPTAAMGVGIAVLTGAYSLGIPALIAVGAVLACTQLVAIPVTRSLDATDAVLISRLEKRLGVQFPLESWLPDYKQEEL